MCGSKVSTVLQVALPLDGERRVAVPTTGSVGAEKLLEHGDPLHYGWIANRHPEVDPLSRTTNLDS
jgi:hypothetical protein